jgi:hypothetical protein
MVGGVVYGARDQAGRGERGLADEHRKIDVAVCRGLAARVRAEEMRLEGLASRLPNPPDLLTDAVERFHREPSVPVE